MPPEAESLEEIIRSEFQKTKDASRQQFEDFKGELRAALAEQTCSLIQCFADSCQALSDDIEAMHKDVTDMRSDVREMDSVITSPSSIRPHAKRAFELPLIRDQIGSPQFGSRLVFSVTTGEPAYSHKNRHFYSQCLSFTPEGARKIRTGRF